MNRVQSQIISLEKEKYAIPQEHLTELVRIPAKEIKNRIDKVGNSTVIRLRDDFLPLLELTQILDVENQAPKNSNSTTLKIAIVHADGYRYGIVVDQFCDPEHVTVLPAGRFLSKAGIYTCSAILKDEKAVLVLDIPGIAHKLNLSAANTAVDKAVSPDTSKEDPSKKMVSLLTFKNEKTEHFAVDLGFVERLERVGKDEFEQVSNKTVMKYRNGILPVFEVCDFLNCADPGQADMWEVLVLKHENFLAGLKVRPPIDAVECLMTLDTSILSTPSVAGTIVLNNKSTLLLDVPELLKTTQGKTES